MSVSPGRSRIADLTFHVFRRPLHPDWFMTKAFRRVEHRGWGADLRIIEGGHAVLFRSGPVCLSEILAGPDTVLPEPGLLFHCHLRHERTAHLRPGGLIEYQSCVDVERVDLEIFRHLCEEMTLDARATASSTASDRPTAWHPHRSAISTLTPGPARWRSTRFTPSPTNARSSGPNPCSS